jgi:hypothetical protein
MADVNNTVEGGPPQSVAALEELFGAYDATRDLPENLEIPEYLWHYTTGAGLKGIIESDALWATEIHYLNDVGEFNLVTALMTQELASRVDSSPHKAALAAAQHYFSRTDFASAAGLLICSFTTERDQLSQWRGYTEPGDGYNIGIAGAHIKNIVPIESGHLRPCNYDPAHAFSIMRNAVTTSFERFAVHGSEKQLIDELRTHVVLMAAWCKHESFREEHEWRLVLLPPTFLRAAGIATPDLQFRPGRYTIIPHASVPLQLGNPDAKPVVRVGPGPYQLLAQHAVERLAEWRGVNITVDVSSTTFRAW